MRRAIQAMTPLVFIGKEIERRAQEGEAASILGNTGPIQYHRHQTAKTRAADAGLILRDLLAHLIVEIRSGKLDPKLANSISYLGAGFLRALEVSGLEKRLEALEQLEEMKLPF
jgi:hypothetical protein